MENTEMIVQGTGGFDLAGFSGEGAMIIGRPAETEKEKEALYNALSSATTAVGDHIGKAINLINFVIEPITIESEEQGAVALPRTILFDENGDTFGCASLGIYSSLRRIVGMFGMPATWDKPKKVTVVQKNVAKGRVYTLEFVKK